MPRSMMKQRDIIEDFKLRCDIEVDWDYNEDEGVTIDAVWLLLDNRTYVDGKVINTVDRINITDYGADLDVINDHIWENYIYG